MTMTELVSRLVAINSVNPDLVPGAPGERVIADFAAGWLVARGVSVNEISCGVAGADRPSLLCRVPGTGGGRSLLLYAHTDTVGVAGMDAPFTPAIRDGALHGRGAYAGGLALYAWDGGQWIKETSSRVNPVSNAVIATPTHFSIWGVLGPARKDAYLPVARR